MALQYVADLPEAEQTLIRFSIDSRALLIASAGLLLAAAIRLGRDGLTGPVTWAIAAVCFILLLTTKLDTLWMILGAELVSLTASSVGLMAYL